ncbi:MAG: transporter substrate-binding domain-containing protein [Limnohabitans sp.]
MAALFSSSQVPSSLAQTAGSVSVGFLSHYPPFSFRDRDGTLKGFDLDVMQRLCAVMNVNLVQVPEGMVALSQKLRAGQIDWIGNQLLTTPENRREFDFVRPSYASIQLTSVQHEDDNRDFLSLDDLLGKKLGVLAQTGIEDQARGALGKSVVAYEHIEDALKDLAAKKLDAVLEENLIAEYYIERDALPVKVTAPFASPIPVGLAVRKGQRAMQTKLSEAIQTMLKDGSMKVISEKWFGYDVSRPRMGHAMSS